MCMFKSYPPAPRDIWIWGFWEVTRIRKKHEGGVLMNEISTSCPLSVLFHVEIQWEVDNLLSTESEHAGNLTSRTVRNKCLLFVSHPFYGIFYGSPSWLKYCSLSDCLENSCFIYSCLIVVIVIASSWRLNPVLVTLSCPEVVLLEFFFF